MRWCGFCSEQGEFCTYHVQSAYKKHSAKRSELQAGYVILLCGNLCTCVHIAVHYSVFVCTTEQQQQSFYGSLYQVGRKALTPSVS